MLVTKDPSAPQGTHSSWMPAGNHESHRPGPIQSGIFSRLQHRNRVLTMTMHTYPCIDVYQAASGDEVDEGSSGASALISLPFCVVSNQSLPIYLLLCMCKIYPTFLSASCHLHQCLHLNMVLNVNQRGFQQRLAVVEQILQSHDLRVSECCCHEAEFDCPFANCVSCRL